IINVNTSSNETLSNNNISINSNSDTEYDNKLSTKPKSKKNENKKSPNGERECGQLIKTQGSTGNFQSHLNTYGITKPIEKNNTAHAAKQNPRQNESIEHALVIWIITNSQPLHVLQIECLKAFFKTELKTCSLTCDLWTACSKSG
ncbi:7485_t:CDS:2, partial [Dentiscutata erythropus]